MFSEFAGLDATEDILLKMLIHELWSHFVSWDICELGRFEMGPAVTCDGSKWISWDGVVTVKSGHNFSSHFSSWVCLYIVLFVGWVAFVVVVRICQMDILLIVNQIFQKCFINIITICSHYVSVYVTVCNTYLLGIKLFYLFF